MYDFVMGSEAAFVKWNSKENETTAKMMLCLTFSKVKEKDYKKPSVIFHLGEYSYLCKMNATTNRIRAVSVTQNSRSTCREAKMEFVQRKLLH